MFDFSGKHAVVTGGGKGIGLAIAQGLSVAGASVTVMGRDFGRLSEAASGFGGHAIAVDVTLADSVRKAFEGLEPVDFLINNAGAADTASFEKTDEALWHRMLEVNLSGAYRCTHAVISGMRTRPYGRIVNIASSASLKGYPYVSAYCAAKHGLLGLTRALALELAKTSITVNAVCPGYTETDLLTDSVQRIVEATGRSEAEARAMLLKGDKQERFVLPSEVASSVLWLCSPEAQGTNGEAISIGGGEVAT